MTGTTLQCDSAPSTVAIGQQFTVVLSSNHPGSEVECFHDNVYGQHGIVPLNGDVALGRKNGVFTFKLSFQKSPPGPDYPGPYTLPMALKIKFTLAAVKDRKWDPLAHVDVPITVT